jgi:glycine cleavage system H protein
MVSKTAIRLGATCVWMDAGLLTYKLCDRDFDCEHCPLDAALRGTSCIHQATPCEIEREGTAEPSFPDDRLYSCSHTWVQPVAGSRDRIRFGLDGFGTSIMPDPLHARLVAPPARLVRGDRLCDIRFREGGLRISIPLGARVIGWNPEVDEHPSAIVESPYGHGWIAELVVTQPVQLGELLSAMAIREQSRLDSRRFRRRLAFHLMAEDAASDHAARPEGPRLCADIRQCLGWSRFFDLLQELIG